MATANEELLQRAMTEVMQHRNTNYIDVAFSSAFVGHDTTGNTFTLNDFKMGVEELHDALSEISVEIADQISAGDKVATRWTGTAIHTGAFKGIPATNKRIRVTGISINRIADGQIVEAWEITDDLGVMMQLGAIERLPSENQAF